MALVPVLLTGCGRMYRLTGRVVVVQPGGFSQPGIFEVTGRPLPAGGESVAGARVWLFHELRADGSPVRDSVWQAATVTRPDGTFDLSSYATPGRKNRVGLEVTADGFTAVYTTYWDYARPDEQVFLIVLQRAEPLG